MAPRQLVFEGPTPESVILEACSVYGPNVQLTAPERTRTGGVGGFFAKNAYRVQVIPPTEGDAARQGEAPATSVLDQFLRSEPDVTVELNATAPGTFDDALERATDALGPPTTEGSPNDAFEALIASLRGDSSPAESGVASAASSPRQQPAAGPHNGAPTAEMPARPARVIRADSAQSTITPLAAVPSPTALGAMAPATAGEAPHPRLGADLLFDRESDVGSVSAPNLPAPSAPATATALAERPPVHPEGLPARSPATPMAIPTPLGPALSETASDELSSFEAPLPETPPIGRLTPAPRTNAAPPAHVEHAARTAESNPSERPRTPSMFSESSGSMVAMLRSTAFPTQLLASAAGQLRAGFGLEEVFGTLPAPRALPKMPGALIAVIGDERRALFHSRRIAAELGLEADEVALCRPGGRALSPASARRPAPSGRRTTPAPRRSGAPIAPDLYASSAEGAQALSPGWRRDRVGVVAVTVRDDHAGAPATRAMLRALRPSMTLLVADAARKATDLEFLSQALGGVDALIVENLDATMAPGEICATGIPVAQLGEEPATPAAWACLVERTFERRSGGTEA